MNGIEWTNNTQVKHNVSQAKSLRKTMKAL